jgi:hypothetical protein
LSVQTVQSECDSDVESARSPASLSSRLALFVFCALETFSFVFCLVVGRRLWFATDEWDFLAGRSATSPHDLFKAHYGHWTTVPILIYRFLWWLVGLRSYAPYLFVVVAMHVAVAALLRCVMRRAGVGSWTATAAAGLYAVFGSGAEDMLRAFQICFTAALVFGLTHLLLADHDGPIDRRDWFGLAAGFGALMCSAVGIVLAGVVVLAMLVRRGWRIAMLHGGPLIAAYAVWWLSIGHSGAPRVVVDMRVEARWLREGVPAVFAALMKGTGLGPILAVIVLAGLALAGFRVVRSRQWRQAAVPAALVMGGLGFLGVAALGRGAAFFGNPQSPRYRDIVTAMLLPAIAIGVDEFRRRWRVLAPAAIALFVLGLPANINALARFAHTNTAVDQRTRRLVETLPATPIARAVPRSVTPVQPFITIGWLLDAARSGRLPKPSPLSHAELRANTFRLSLLQTSTRAPSRECHPVVGTESVTLPPGGSIGIEDWPLDIADASGTPAGVGLYFNSGNGNRLVDVAGTLHLDITSRSPFLPGVLCRLAP